MKPPIFAAKFTCTFGFCPPKIAETYSNKYLNRLQGKAIRTCQQRVQNFSYTNVCVYQSLVIRTCKTTSVSKTLVIRTPRVQNFSYTNAACTSFQLYRHANLQACPKLQLYERRVFKTLVIRTPHVQNLSNTNATCVTFYSYGHVKKASEKCKNKGRRGYRER